MITSADMRNNSILIVDEQEANVQLLEQMLQAIGHTRITTTQDSPVVCALHREHQYDLILLDILMPGMDGLQVMKGLKNQGQGLSSRVCHDAQLDHMLRAHFCRCEGLHLQTISVNGGDSTHARPTGSTLALQFGSPC